MKKQLYLVLLTLIFALPVSAQQGSITISGKITGADDQQPIHAVSVSIDKKGIGVSTNSAGIFGLMIPAANLNDTLKISCIGYKTQKMPINGLRNGQQLNIAIEKNNNELKEVSIAYYDPLKIIQKAIDRIPLNYINHPHIIRGFYRMYTFNGDTPLQLSEAVFDVYNFGYADKRADQFRLIKARNEKNERDLNSLELGQKPNSVFEADIVNHLFASGLLSDAGLEKHLFEVKGTVDVKGHVAYEIYFKEKPGTVDQTFRGKMYIDTKTHAFIYFDFGLSPSGLKDLGSTNFAKRSLAGARDVDMALTRDHSTISYQEVGNKWVLADMEGDDVLRITPLGSNKSLTAHVKFNYQVTSVDTAQTSSFKSKIGRNENINDQENDESEKFWKDYNILLSDYNTEDTFKQIRAINQANTSKNKLIK